MKTIDIKGSPVAFRCSSSAAAESIIDASKALSKGEKFVLLIKDEDKLLKRVLPAYINAKIRSEDSTMRAKSMRMEMLLFIAGTMNLGKAIDRSGAKGGRFIAVADSAESFLAFRKACGIADAKECKLELDMDVAVDVSVTELSESK